MLVHHQCTKALPHHRIVCLGHLICTTMCCVYTAHLPTCCSLGIWRLLSPCSRIKYAGRQSVQGVPARECRNDCVLCGHPVILGSSANALASLCLSKRGPGQVNFLAGTRSLNLLHNHPSLVNHSLFFPARIMVHGFIHSIRLHCSLERKETKSSRNAPPKTCLSSAVADPSRPSVRLGTAFYSATVDCSHEFRACQ